MRRHERRATPSARVRLAASFLKILSSCKAAFTISFRFEVKLGPDPESVQRVVGLVQTGAFPHSARWWGQLFKKNCGGDKKGEGSERREFDASFAAANLAFTPVTAQTLQRNRAGFGRHGLDNSFELGGN